MSATETIRLKPCPFCGGKPKFEELGDADSYSVTCTGCEVQQIANYLPHEAAERWNRRSTAAPDEIEAIVPRHRVWPRRVPV